MCPANQGTERQQHKLASHQSGESGKCQLFLFCFTFTPVIFFLHSAAHAAKNAFKLGKRVDSIDSSPASDVALGNAVSLVLEPSSGDIEHKDEPDSRPPKHGGGSKGGRWESGWKAERKPAGLADQTDQGRSLDAPRSTKTLRKWGQIMLQVSHRYGANVSFSSRW